MTSMRQYRIVERETVSFLCRDREEGDDIGGTIAAIPIIVDDMEGLKRLIEIVNELERRCHASEEPLDLA